MAKTIVKVAGLRQLEAALSQLPKATGKVVLRRIAKQALQPVDKAWRENALAHRLTGALDESGGVTTKLTKRQARLNRKREGRSAIEMYAGPNNPAAVPGEFGTVDQAARPFLRPAWDAKKGEVLDIVSGELGAAIEAAAKRVAKRLAKKAGR